MPISVFIASALRRYYDCPLIIDYSHNYGPADFYPGTTAPPDRVVVPRN